MSKTTTFTSPHPLNTAVLFLVFNRLDTTKQVFEAIRQAKPPRLYIAADGARANKEGEEQRSQAVRDYILQSIDWDCEVKTLFRNKNLGCKHAVSGAITWFFENEEQGIILEDDVVPNQDFFYFVESSLEKYKSDNRLMMVTGTNYLSCTNCEESYFFSEHMTIWGWGTWKRAWDLYDVDMKEWKSLAAKNFFHEKYFGTYIWKHFRNTFTSLDSDYMDTWDIQWVFTCLYNHGLCVTPKVNLISNVGVEGTHGSGVTDSHFIKRESLEYSSYHNYHPHVHVNYRYDHALHNLKSKKAVRNQLVISLLKRSHLFSILRLVKRSVWNKLKLGNN